MTRGWRAVAAMTPVVVVIILWQVLIPAGSRTAFLLGRPDEIARAARNLVQDPTYWQDLGASVRVLVQGYGLGIIGGMVIGLVVWRLRNFGRIAEAYLVALGSIPLFAVAPLLIFVLGIGVETRVFIVTLSVLVPMALAAVSAAAETERHYSDLLRSFPRSRWQELRLIIAPGTLFACLPMLKPSANAALVAVFLSEWISAQNGLAKFVLASMSIYNVPQMWVGLLTFVLLGVGFGSIVDLVERHVTKWRLS